MGVFHVLQIVQMVLIMQSVSFDCLSHELLIVKIDAHGFDKRFLISIYNYLSYRKQSVKINDSYSSWSKILLGVPQ